MNAAEIKDLLREGVCELKFTKANGEERIAHATLKQSLMEEDRLPKGTGVPYTDQQIRFYDCDIDEWRSCLAESVITVTLMEIENV